MHEPMLRYFVYDHLPPELTEVSRSFSLLAHGLVGCLPRCPERFVEHFSPHGACVTDWTRKAAV